MPASPPPTDSWEGMLANLRRRYPGQKDSVLFCVHKLQQNPELSLRDFRDEAALYGIPMAGRALHSARVLLGLQQATPKPARKQQPAAATSPSSAPSSSQWSSPSASAASTAEPTRVRRPRRDDDDSIEHQVLDAVRQIQSAAGADAQRLRRAVQQAIEILQAALDERS